MMASLSRSVLVTLKYIKEKPFPHCAKENSGNFAATNQVLFHIYVVFPERFPEALYLYFQFEILPIVLQETFSLLNTEICFNCLCNICSADLKSK